MRTALEKIVSTISIAVLSNAASDVFITHILETSNVAASHQVQIASPCKVASSSPVNDSVRKVVLLNSN